MQAVCGEAGTAAFEGYGISVEWEAKKWHFRKDDCGHASVIRNTLGLEKISAVRNDTYAVRNRKT